LGIRKKLYEKEAFYLSKYAVKSNKTSGREIKETPCDFRTEFQRDRDRIIHCHHFRRLKSKTQVFVTPKNDLVRTRLTHTLEVSQLARTIARALFLNEDLVEAISLGHDVGHTPFGHAGEEALDKIYKPGFRHNLQSVRVVEKLAKNGKGLNLTKEVIQGIKYHSKGSGKILGEEMNFLSLEAQIVRITDRIAYINHDIDDAISEGLITEEDLPKSEMKILGRKYSERLNTMVSAVVEASENKNRIDIKKEVLDAIENLKNFMFRNVYSDSSVLKDENEPKKILTELFNFLVKYPDSILEQNIIPFIGQDNEQLAVDFIATLGDFEALDYYKKFICETYESDRYLQLRLF
jgi:dGTPase